MTDAQRRRRVEEVCDAALEREAGERAGFVAAACGSDEVLRQEVEALLGYAQAAERFLAEPLGEVAAQVLCDSAEASPIGREIGPYKILSRLGAGGMGEVYRARDTKLNRDVALKILPPAFAVDPDRLARFQREAQILASLSHPNIANIYGIEEATGVRALVLELVEGPTLADRIAQGPIPLDETGSIALQIAAALEAAHDQGFIHRDLKPANLKLRPDGTVKVLDFGLAKALDGGSISKSPTITSSGMHRTGVMLGTPAYMSPEQAKGLAVDKRTDIWAFGCVLYEMLAGKRALDAEEIFNPLASILTNGPEWGALPHDTPESIRKLLRHCLAKDRKHRLADLADARLQLEDALNEPNGPTMVSSVHKSREWQMWTVAILVGVIAALVMTVLYFRRGPLEAPEMRLHVNTPPGHPISFAISPDGRNLVFHAGNELWLRPLASETAQPLAGTSRSCCPFWSPDGRSIGFYGNPKWKRIDIANGSVQTLADGDAYGATWGIDGTVLFTVGNTSPLYRVQASGGAPVEATHLDSKQISHRFPHFLPDGRHFLFFATGAPGVQGVYVGSLDSKDTRRLVDADTAAVFTPPDYVLFVRQDTLLVQRLDLRQLKLVGDPVAVTERVARHPRIVASVSLSASAAGPLAYRTDASVPRQLVWLDRSGKQTSAVGEPDADEPDSPRLSPDGRTVALRRRVGGNRDVWLTDIARGIRRRFTFDAAAENNPIWSPDGSRIAFHASRKGGGLNDLYLRPVSDPGRETLLLETSENKNIQDWSPDGRFILYSNFSQKTRSIDLWALPLDGDGKPFRAVQPRSSASSAAITDFAEEVGRFSPDGRWIVYDSSETGEMEVYIQPFPGPGRSWQVSTNGGADPRWRGDGREIFYRGPGNRLMAVPVSLQANRALADLGTPVALFPMRLGSQYDSSPDGQRFLIDAFVGDASTLPITIMLNWTTRLKR